MPDALVLIIPKRPICLPSRSPPESAVEQPQLVWSLSGPEEPRKPSGLDEAVAEIALRVDRVVTQPIAQPLAQLADMALDDVLIDVVAE
jgi:hypothetical protein